MNEIIEKRIMVTPEGVDMLLQLTDAVEMLHHGDIPRSDIIEKLIAIPRDEINRANEIMRQWKQETKIVADEQA